MVLLPPGRDQLERTEELLRHFDGSSEEEDVSTREESEEEEEQQQQQQQQQVKGHNLLHQIG